MALAYAVASLFCKDISVIYIIYYTSRYKYWYRSIYLIV